MNKSKYILYQTKKKSYKQTYFHQKNTRILRIKTDFYFYKFYLYKCFFRIIKGIFKPIFEM
ncbi:MAG: hypothetical protein EAZ85_00645 [Bacteroidetes bacterium]|nr:MAG: hypothetical protein EAZ85_00645 [Bacteroidota bacterium]TAG85632.1 MAG: hypothetical protein EAZ20_14625 [Bacteroidota bacterium]